MLIYCHYLRGGTGLQAQLPRPNGDKSEQYRTRHRVTDLIPVHVSEPQSNGLTLKRGAVTTCHARLDGGVGGMVAPGGASSSRQAHRTGEA